MPSALILSSFVASSRVGGMIQALAFSAAGVEPRLIPTVLFGRHPGLGPPGGGAVGPETFEGVLAMAEAQGVFNADVVLTGYFSLPRQVVLAAEAIERAKSSDKPPFILVDPIMGDDGPGLYVKPEVERALRDRLLPLADLIAPNRWELERLSGRPITDTQSAAQAARAFPVPTLVSSMPSGPDQIGVLYVDADVAWLASHACAVGAPRGTGDLLKAAFAVGLLRGEPVQTRLARAVGAVADAVEAAVAGGLEDLPLVHFAERLQTPTSPIVLSFLAAEPSA